MSKQVTADDLLDSIRDKEFLKIPSRPLGNTRGLGTETMDPTAYTAEQLADMQPKLMQGLYELDKNITPPEPPLGAFDIGNITPTLGLTNKCRVILYAGRHGVTGAIKASWSDQFYLRFENMLMPAEDNLYKVRNTDEDRAFCKLASEVLVAQHEEWARQFGNTAPEVCHAGSPAYLSRFADKCLQRTFARLLWEKGQPVRVEVLDGNKLWSADLRAKNAYAGENTPTHDGQFRRAE